MGPLIALVVSVIILPSLGRCVETGIAKSIVFTHFNQVAPNAQSNWTGVLLGSAMGFCIVIIAGIVHSFFDRSLAVWAILALLFVMVSLDFIVIKSLAEQRRQYEEASSVWSRKAIPNMMENPLGSITIPPEVSLASISKRAFEMVLCGVVGHIVGVGIGAWVHYS